VPVFEPELSAAAAYQTLIPQVNRRLLELNERPTFDIEDRQRLIHVIDAATGKHLMNPLVSKPGYEFTCLDRTRGSRFCFWNGTGSVSAIQTHDMTGRMMSAIGCESDSDLSSAVPPSLDFVWLHKRSGEPTVLFRTGDGGVVFSWNETQPQTAYASDKFVVIMYGWSNDTLLRFFFADGSLPRPAATVLIPAKYDIWVDMEISGTDVFVWVPYVGVFYISLAGSAPSPAAVLVLRFGTDRVGCEKAEGGLFVVSTASDAIAVIYKAEGLFPCFPHMLFSLAVPRSLDDHRQ